jgi:outer membrane receptor protein involved in Fe transport
MRYAQNTAANPAAFLLSGARIFVTLILLVACLATMVNAQTSRGAVTGIVHDPTGAVFANAEVTATSVATGVSQSTKSNSAGNYRIDALIIGDYSITVKAAGFATMKSTATVASGQAVGVDFTLKVAASSETIAVEATAPQLQTEEAVRGAAIPAQALANLPISGQNSLNLMLIVPGIAKSNQGGSLDSGIGSVNGARARSNNFMIDGAQNNDISVAGPSFSMTNNDAIQEVSIQTSNFTSEFGRSGGAVINQVTKSGTNNLHGTAAWVYKSQALDAATLSQIQAYSGGSTSTLKDTYHENIPAFTVGGPVYIPKVIDGRNKLFFFSAGQWDRYQQNQVTTFSAVPTANGVATLQALASNCPNVAYYLGLLGPARGTGTTGLQNISIALPNAVAATSCGGGQRTGQAVEVSRYYRTAPRAFKDFNILERVDWTVSQKQNLSFRFLYDKQSDTSGNVGINPAFDIPFNGLTLGANLNHVYTFKPNLLNEFRFGYIRYNYGWFFPDSNSIGATAPDLSITSLSNLTVASTYPQGRIANSYQFQDTVGWTVGKHSFRFGAEFLRQISTQVAPFNSRGQVGYTTTANNSFSGGVITGLANFIDNYSGTSTNPVAISFGSGEYHPNLFSYAFFFQDSWKVSPTFTLNYGIRYENFGQAANDFKYPAFVGYGTADILSTAKVNPDNNNFGPSIGFAWNPLQKFVLRGGYGVSYDTFYNNLLSNMAAGSPNALANIAVPGASTLATPRGLYNVSSILPMLQPSAVTPYSNQTSIFSQNIRNPYGHRFSFGIQYELPANMVMDLSYVGSLGRQLFYTNPLNPAVPNATFTAADTQTVTGAANCGSNINGPITSCSVTKRLYPNRGLIQIRDSGLTSNYNAMQLVVRRKFGNLGHFGGLMFSSAFTWSKNMDVLTETFASNSSGQNPSRSPAWGTPLKVLDYGPSDNDRRFVWSSAAQWNLPGPKKGVLGVLAGGWSVAPVLQVQSGTPFTILDGSDRDWDGSTLGDRANLGNVNAPVNARAKAVATSVCASGLQNPAIGTANGVGCVTANDVHFIQVTAYSPTSDLIVGRNANYTNGYIQLDANIMKTFKLGERFNLEYRAEIFDVTNHVNFNTPVSSTNRNVTSSVGTDFLNYQLTSPGARSMRMGLKLIF